MEETEADIKDISYGTLLFRHIDRILSLSSKDFANDTDKLFTFNWSVKLLRVSIPSKIIDKEFEEWEKDFTMDGKNYKEQFIQIQELLGACINLLARKGYLFKQISKGDYYDES